MKKLLLIYILLIALAVFALSACSQNNEPHIIDTESIERLQLENSAMESTISQLEATIAQLETAAYESREAVSGFSKDTLAYEVAPCEGDCLELLLPDLWAEISGVSSFTQANLFGNEEHNMQQMREHIRVFENGNANVRLFPDGSFIANLFHNTKITGAYSEMTQGHETAVLFTYGGITNLSGGVSTFDVTGPVTAVGGIVNDVLTIPEDWDDGHGHGMDFSYREYPLVFVGENDQRIILNADNTFVADLSSDVTIIGFFGVRATSITFVPGSPTFTGDGVPVGTFLFAELRSCGDDHDCSDDHDCDDGHDCSDHHGHHHHDHHHHDCDDDDDDHHHDHHHDCDEDHNS